MARTRTHILDPLGRCMTAVLDFVTLVCGVQLVAVIGSGLVCTS
jgi:hypothetical protein